MEPDLDLISVTTENWQLAHHVHDLPNDQSLIIEDQAGFNCQISEFSKSLLLTGQYDQLLLFLSSLNPDFAGNQPLLLVYKAAAMLFTEQPGDKIEWVLNVAEQLDCMAQYEGEIQSIRAILASHYQSPEDGIELAHTALQKIEPGNIFFKNLIERNLGIAYTLKNDLLNANIHLENLLRSSYKLQDKGSILAAYNYLTYLRKVQGRLNEAGVIYAKALDFIENHQLELLPHSIKIFAGYGGLLLHWNRILEAQNYCCKAIKFANKTDIRFGYTAYQNLCETFVRLNDITDALATIRELRARVQEKDDLYGQMHVQHTLAIEARIQLEAGKHKEAHTWLESIGFDRIPATKLQHRFGYELGYILPLAARIYFQKHDVEKAIQVLKTNIPKFIHQGANSFLIRSLNALAFIYYKKGQSQRGLDVLTKAIRLAEPENNQGDFLLMGNEFLPVLQNAQENDVAPDFCRNIRAHFAFTTVQNHIESSKLNASPLSLREIDVLGLIAKGLTNREIALALYLSANTVKTHSKNIYKKLDVKNRSQAVRKARSLGILTQPKAGPYHHYTNTRY